jgi:hypothetical protein
LHSLRNLFDPSLHYTQSGDTGILAGNLNTVTSLGGSLAVDHSWSRYRLNAAYKGGQSLYHPDSFYNQTYHDLAIAQEVRGGRWTLRLRDVSVISQDAAFGGLNTGGPGLAANGGSTVQVQPSLAPGDSVLISRAKRVSSTAVGEVDYALSRRTSLTFTGSYGLLDFVNGGGIDTRTVNARAGYNYALSAKNSIAFIYGYSHISFKGAGYWVHGDMVQASFGRRITGRLAFQGAAGAELSRIENVAASSSRDLSWNLSASLKYAQQRTQYSLSYFRGLTGGSGAFFGARTDTLTAGLEHRLTRSWSGSLNGGYSINRDLAVSPTARRYDNWFGGSSLGRPIGRHLHFRLSYGLQQQTETGVTGQAPAIGYTGLRQTFGVTMEWHPLSRQVE